jgi:hypothetical protein
MEELDASAWLGPANPRSFRTHSGLLGRANATLGRADSTNPSSFRTHYSLSSYTVLHPRDGEPERIITRRYSVVVLNLFAK